MYSPQMTDAFRHGQVTGPWTVSSTARQPHYCHTPYGMPRPQGEMNNNFDAFYSDVFLNDFDNVDTSQYNVGLQAVGGWHGNPYVSNYTTGHRHMLIGTSAMTKHRRYDSTTLSRSTSWTNPDLHPQHQLSFRRGDIKPPYLENCVLQERIQPQAGCNPEDVDGNCEQDEILKRLLGDGVDEYVRVQPTKGTVDDRALESQEKDHHAGVELAGVQPAKGTVDDRTLESQKDHRAGVELAGAQPAKGTVDDRALESQEKDHHAGVELDPSLNLELGNGSIKVLQIMDLQHIKREDLEDLKKEFREHQQMWNTEQDQTSNSEETPNSNSAQNGGYGANENDSQRESPDTVYSSTAIQCGDNSKTVHLDSGRPLQKSTDFSDNPRINDMGLVPAGHLSAQNNGTSTTLNIASTETPSEQMFLTSPELHDDFNTIPMLTDSLLQESKYTVLQERSVNNVTSSEDLFTYSRSFEAEVTPDWKDAEVTSSDHVTSTTGSGEPKRRSRDIREGNEPRRPKNGFIRFSIEHRTKIAAQHPKMDNREISRILGCKWRKMTVEAKKRYEDEFEKDIQSIREEHPEWRYAPAKRLSEELIEPMPSRLRPRSSLKRKFPFQTRPYKRRQSRTTKKKDRSTEPGSLLQTTWMQCDLCGKWRCVPVCIPKHKLYGVWFCYCNPDPRYNSCSVAEYEDLKPPSSPPLCSLPPSPSSTPSPTSYTTYSNSNAHVLFREPSW